MNSYEIIDEYGYEYPKVLENVIDKVLEKEKVKNSIFTIIFIDNKKIKEINKEYRNKDIETDVISFALMDEKDMISPMNILGDIYISIPKMVSQAKEYGHGEVREICFLCTHGLLHLLGYDHMTKEDETEMFGKQEEVLNEFKETRKDGNYKEIWI